MPNSRGSSHGEPAERLDERTVGNLVGRGGSQIARDATMRTRDINRPTADDLAEAERTLQVVHRKWRPPQ